MPPRQGLKSFDSEARSQIIAYLVRFAAAFQLASWRLAHVALPRIQVCLHTDVSSTGLLLRYERHTVDQVSLRLCHDEKRDPYSSGDGITAPGEW